MYPSSPSVSFTASFFPPRRGAPRTNQLKASFNLRRNHHSQEWRDSNVFKGFRRASKRFAHILPTFFHARLHLHGGIEQTGHVHKVAVEQIRVHVQRHARVLVAQHPL